MALICVKIDGQFGFINENGDVVIEPRFTVGGEFSEGRAKVRIGEDEFFIDEKGDIVFQTRFKTYCTFSEQRCTIVHDGKQGFIDEFGRIVILPQYEKTYDFHNGYAVVKPQKSPHRLIDREGRTVLEDIGLSYTSRYEEGLINLEAWRDGRLCAGFVDRNGNWAIEPEYASVFPFHEGLAAVQHRRTGKFGFIDRENIFRIEARYEGHDLWFGEGLCPVDAALYTGFIDRDGGVAIDAKFHHAEHFSCGRSLACEVDDGPEGFIDKDGRWVVKPRYEHAMAFEDGVAFVSDGYIDTDGNYIWEFED